MKRTILTLVGVTALAGLAVQTDRASGQTAGSAIELPAGYRDWKLIAVAHEEGALNDLRAILGNDIAVKAAREGTLSYPDGAILARLAWTYQPLAESEAAFGRAQSFVAGMPKNGVQFLVKDATKFAATGGWGYAQFDDGKPSASAMPDGCFACHTVVKARDFVFNRYAP